MTDKLSKEQKEAIENFRKEKDNPNSMASFFYGVLKGASPLLVNHMEAQAGTFLAGAQKMNQIMAELEKDSKKKKEFKDNMERLALKINSTVYNVEKKPNSKKKPSTKKEGTDKKETADNKETVVKKEEDNVK